MLITFHSKDYYPIEMFGDIALQLIEKMGCRPKAPGAIYAEDVPQALWQLQQNLQELEEDQQLEFDEDGQAVQKISLRQRAVPLIEMLQKAAKAQHIVSWD